MGRQEAKRLGCQKRSRLGGKSQRQGPQLGSVQALGYKAPAAAASRHLAQGGPFTLAASRREDLLARVVGAHAYHMHRLMVVVVVVVLVAVTRHQDHGEQQAAQHNLQRRE